MNQGSFKCKLSAVLSADPVVCSRLMGDNDEAAVLTLTAFRTAISNLVLQFRGRIVDYRVYQEAGRDFGKTGCSGQ